jgi:hypothetical protein
MTKTKREKQVERLTIAAFHIKAALRAIRMKQQPKDSIKLALEWLAECPRN